MASPTVIWDVIKQSNAFVVAKGHGDARIVFSKDPSNLTNQHSFKASGLAQRKTIGVVVGTHKVKGELKAQVKLLHSTKSVTKPSKATQKDGLSRNPARAAKSISAVAASRKDLAGSALRRYTALSKASAKGKVTQISVGRHNKIVAL